MFKKIQEKLDKKYKDDLDRWYKKCIRLVKEHKPDILWDYIKDNIQYRDCRITYGGFGNCYIIITTPDYEEFHSNKFHRIDALFDIAKQVYRYKYAKIKSV